MNTTTSLNKSLSPKNNLYISKSLSSKNFFNNYPLNINVSNDVFEKTSNLKSLNTFGIPAELIYKKTPTNRKNFDFHNNFFDIKNNYISDGGLTNKINKFNEDPTYIKNNLVKSSSQNKNLLDNKSYNEMFKYNSQSMKNIHNNNNNLIKSKKKIDNIKSTDYDSNNNNKIKKNNYFQTDRIKHSNLNSSQKLNSKNKTNINSKKNSSKKKKTSSNNINNNNNNENEEEIKINYMNQLIEDGVARIINSFQTEKKPITKEEKINEYKQKVVVENGVVIHTETLDSESNINNNEENNHKEEESKVKEADEENYENKFKSNTNRIPKLNNYLSDTNIFSSSSLKNKKNNLKPKIDYFEYINKINDEIKKIPGNNSKSSSILIKPKSNKNKNKNNNNKNLLLDDSFRHHNNSNKNSAKKTKKNLSSRISPKSYNNNNNNSNSNYDSEFLFSYPKNHRTKEELIKFREEKKLKQKKEEEKTDTEKNQKLFSIYKNLYNLSNRDSQTDDISNSKNTSKKNKNIKHNKNKIKNDYYVGTEGNNSTIIDANEYLMDILQSQLILVNGNLNPIEDIDEENINNINSNIYNNNSNGINENSRHSSNISKDEIKRITEKESKYVLDVDGDKKLNDLKEKVNKSISRANKLFENEGLNNLLNSQSKSNYDSNKSDKKEQSKL